MAATDLTTAVDLAALEALVARTPAVLAYFSTPECRVCQSLRPKVAVLLAEDFPRMATAYIDCRAAPDAAGRYGVFSVPTLIAFFEGREWLRWGRAVGLGEIRAGLARPYGLLFDPD